jgi:hypothetical protein
MRPNELLTDPAFDDLIIASVESIYKRGVLISHNTRMGHRLKIAEREIARLQALAEGSARPCSEDTLRNAQEGHQKAQESPPPTEIPTDASEAVQTAREAMVAWIEKTNPGDTVRATYARKVAAQLRAGEDLR